MDLNIKHYKFCKGCSEQKLKTWIEMKDSHPDLYQHNKWDPDPYLIIPDPL